MTHIFGFERSQLLLLPEAVDDYVGVDNPVRFVDQFVDGLDLAAGRFQSRHAEGDGPPELRAGRPAEALYLRLSEPGAVKSAAGGRMPSQRRGYLAVANPEARLQNHRRFQE
jgi:hypothetical protein